MLYNSRFQIEVLVMFYCGREKYKTKRRAAVELYVMKYITLVGSTRLKLLKIVVFINT